MSARPKLVLFDCDGTIVDSQVGIVHCMISAFEAGGLTPPTRDEVLATVGLALPVAVARLAARHPDAPLDAIVDSYKAAFYAARTTALHHDPLFPGALETIAMLAARSDVHLGVVTGKGRRGLGAVLAQHGLSTYFSVLKCADDGPSKPHPQIVLDALAETGFEPDRAVVIGDTTFDVEMGKAAGCWAIGVTWGYHPAVDLVSAGADRLVDRYHEIPDAIDALLKD